MLVPLKAHEIHHRGKRRWRIIVGRDWAPVLKCKPGKRRLFSSKEEVQGFITTAQKRLEEFAKGNGSFTDAEFATFRLVLGMVNGDCQKLLTAVQQFVKEEEASPAKKPRKAKVVARHYLMTRNLNGAFRDKTLPTVRYEAGVFTKKFGNILITQIPRNDLQLWIRKLKLEPKTKKNIMGTVKLIFDHAIKLGLIKDNPTIGVELPKIDQAEPERFAASQCELLLKTGVRTKSPALPAVVIELFTGARPAEVARTGWQKVSLKEKRINIPGKAGKTHQYRWVSVPPILRQWLIFFGIKEKGPIMRRGTVSTNVYLRRLHNFALDLGWVGRAVIVRSQWPKGKHKKKRAITWEEHCRIVERDGNVERRDFYQLLWQSGAPQGDLAGLDAEEDIDRRARTFRFFRKKTDSVVFQRFGDGAAEILAHCHKRARSFRIRPHYVPVTGPLNSRSAAKGWALAASRSIPTATLCASSPGSTPVKCPRRRWIGEQGQRTNLFRTGVQ